MQAIKRIRKTIESDPSTPTAKIFAGLVLALESGQEYKLDSLYQLNYDDFETALDMLKEWRLDRHYSAKFRLLDTSMVALDSQTAS